MTLKGRTIIDELGMVHRDNHLISLNYLIPFCTLDVR